MEKSLVFFRSQLTYDIIMFIYKSWSVNFGSLTLFVRSKVTGGDSFAFKALLTIISLQEQSFQQVHCWFKKKVKSSTLFLRTKCVLPSQSTLLTENLLANYHSSKKDILQIIKSSDSNKAHGMIWSAFLS